MSKCDNGQAACPYSLEAYSGYLPTRLMLNRPEIVLSYYSRPFIFHFIKDFLSPSSFCKILSGGAHMLEIVALEREDLRNFPVGLGENINEI